MLFISSKIHSFVEAISKPKSHIDNKNNNSTPRYLTILENIINR